MTDASVLPLSHPTPAKDTLRELSQLLTECLATFDWEQHLRTYASVRDEGQENFAAVLEADRRGEDVTDLVLERLLPHVNTTHNRDTNRWIHIAPSITRDIRTWYEGSGWTKSEDWPEVSRQILRFVTACVDDPQQLAGACEAFAASPVSTGFQSGTLSPILNALRPDDFCLINNKSRQALNYFAGVNHGPALQDYPAANAELLRLVEAASDALARPELEEFRPVDVFDMLCHWLVAEKKFSFRVPTQKYWKVAPGAKAWHWPECLDGGFIAIGWDELGDLSNLSLNEFQARRDELIARDESLTKTALNQVWRFSRMAVGDTVVANNGTTRVIGIGQVTGDYYFDASAGEHKHRVPVEWFDTEVRQVDQPGWRRTFIKLDSSSMEAIENSPIVDQGFVSLAEPSVAEIVDEIAEPSDDEETSSLRDPAQNIVFFGPPGTGKTWSTKSRAVRLCLKLDVDASSKQYNQDFRRLRREGRIEFLTFHQSFAYEEFVEGIRPVMTDDENTEVQYRCEAGTFKAIALRAAAEGVQVSEKEHTFEQLWQKLMQRVLEAEESSGWYEVTTYKDESFGLTATSQGNFRGQRIVDGDHGPELTTQSLGAGKTYVRALWDNRSTLGDDYSAYSYQRISKTIARELGTGGGCHGHLLWAVHFELLKIAGELSASSLKSDLTADQRLDLLKDYLLRGERSGVTLNFEDADDYVLVIDEINRGNISKILGELITLLEPSKRLTEADELIVQLPYSKERFGVPPNLHIIGTMNTADRSIALMDVALRRRFHFEEMRPDWRVIATALQHSLADNVFGGKEDFINLVCAVFENINARIEFLYDQDHQLGHSYFLGLTGYERLREVFLKDVLPLLQEYFYGSWERICLALGCPYDEHGEPARVDRPVYDAPMIQAASLLERDLLGMDHDNFHDQQRFSINPRLVAGGLEPAELKAFFVGILSGIHRDRYERRHYTETARP